jgi:NADH-quinone oxidoreductase subunit A
MVNEFLQDYLSIVIFFFIAIVLSFSFIILNFLLAPNKPDPEKLSAYECGFEAISDSRMEFDIRFYLVAILFIIFDLEIAFLFPWAISLGNLGSLGFWSMIIFLFILTVGFIYEWKKGALDWD